MPEEKMEIVVTLRDRFTAGMKRVTSHISMIGDRVKKVTGFLFNMKSALLGLGVGLIVKSFISAAAASEQYRLRLEALLGSQEEGAKVFADTAEYASKVSFQFEELMRAATALSGVLEGGSKDVKKWLPLLGDLAAVAGLSIEQTTSNFIRMYSAGAASADLFRERGILSMLGFEAGVSYSVERTREMLMKAWEDPASKFKGAAQDLSRTWDGLMSMMADRWFQFRNLVMEAGIYNYIKGMVNELLGFLSKLKEEGKLDEWAEDVSTKVINSFEEMAIGIADIYDVLAPIMFDFKKKVLVVIWDWFKTLPAWVQEIGLIGAIMVGVKGKIVIATLAYAIGETSKAIKEYKESIAGFRGPTFVAEKAISDLTGEIEQLEIELEKDSGWLNFWKGAGYAESLSAKIVILKKKLKELQEQGKEGIGLDEAKVDESMGSKVRKIITVLKDAAKDAATDAGTSIGYAVQDINKFFNDIEWEDAKAKVQAWADTATKTAGEMTKGMKKTIDEFLKQASKLYQEAKAEAESYAAKIIEIEATILAIRMSTADKVRVLSRQLMTDEKAYADEKLQAEQKLSGAKSALAQGDLDLARSLAQEAESIYAGLAREVTKDVGGESVIAQSLATSIAIATQGIQQVGSFSVQIEEKQKSMYVALQEAALTTMETIKQKMDELTAARIANIEIKLTEVEAAQNVINKLIADETKHINIKVTQSTTTKEDDTEGMQRGGVFPGYGGGDRINVLAEAGEGFVRKEAIRKYGRSFFNAYNSLALPINQATRSLKARIGGIIAPDLTSFQQKFRGGGLVAQPSFKSLGTIDLKVGSRSYPVLGSVSVLEELKMAIKRENMLRSN